MVDVASKQGPTSPLPRDSTGYNFISRGGFTRTGGRTLTWSNATGTFGSDWRQSLVAGAVNATVLAAYRAAFAYWAAIADVEFSEVADSASVNIRVGYIGGTPSYIAAVWGFQSTRADARGMFIGNNRSLIESYIPRTPRHEVGHALGLLHTNNADYVYGEGGDYDQTIMETLGHSGGRQSSHVSMAEAGDVLGVWHLWGSADNAQAVVPDVSTAFGVAPAVGGVDMRWGAPVLNGGSAITGYRVNGSTDVAGTSHSETGMAAGASKAFFVQARSAIGLGIHTPHVDCPALDSRNGFSWTAKAALTSGGVVQLGGPAFCLPLSWMSSSALAWISSVDLSPSGSVSFALASRDYDSGTSAGPSLASAAVRSGMSLRFTSGGKAVAVEGISDATEPYSWAPSNAADVAEFLSGVEEGDVVEVHMAQTPTTDTVQHAYLLADSAPELPTSTADVIPENWTDEELSATASANAYRISRTRSTRAEQFVSATAWAWDPSTQPGTPWRQAATTSRLQHAYRRGSSLPSLPVSAAEALPSGWLGDDPSPTAAQAVYRLARTVTERLGAFVSATAWAWSPAESEQPFEATSGEQQFRFSRTIRHKASGATATVTWVVTASDLSGLDGVYYLEPTVIVPVTAEGDAISMADSFSPNNFDVPLTLVKEDGTRSTVTATVTVEVNAAAAVLSGDDADEFEVL